MTYHTPNLVEDLQRRTGENAPSFLRLLREWKNDVAKIVEGMPIKFPSRDRCFARSPRRRWTSVEVEFMRQHYARLGPKKMADQLKRTNHAVLVQARRMGMYRKARP